MLARGKGILSAEHFHRKRDTWTWLGGVIAFSVIGGAAQVGGRPAQGWLLCGLIVATLAAGVVGCVLGYWLVGALYVADDPTPETLHD